MILSAFQFVATLLRFGWTQGNTQAEVAVPVRRVVLATVRRPAIRGIVNPTAASEHAGRALF